MPQTLFSCQSCLSLGSVNGSVAQQSPLVPSLAQTFANLRQTLVASLASQVVDAAVPLAGWRPSGDLGSVVLESWAYVGDVLRFYNGAIVGETYIIAARQRRSLRRIAAILGHHPRPAVSACTEIAGSVKSEAVQLGRGAYRASPPGMPAQVFESTTEFSASQRFNEFRVAPLRDVRADSGADNVYYVDISTAAPVRGRPVAFIWFDDLVVTHATDIVSVSVAKQNDDHEYVAMRVGAAPTFSDAVKREEVAIQSPSQRAYTRTKMFKPTDSPISPATDIVNVDADSIKDLISLVSGGYSGAVNRDVNTFAFSDKSQSYVHLDAVYRSIKSGDFVILQAGDRFKVHRVTMTEEVPQELAVEGDAPPKVPITVLTINPAVKDGFIKSETTDRLIIHYNLHDIGRMTRVALTELQQSDVVGQTLPLEGIHDVPTDPPTRFILEDANGRGELVEGTLDVASNGAATLKVTKGEWDGGLRVPVKAYGNVLDVKRGETVQDEVLGSGDPTQAYQTFKLAKSPLTYLTKPNTPEGIASTLEIRVGGIRWHERPSFYGAGPNDAVYIVRHDDDQNTYVTFGDGVRGMRLPTGRGNVRANYRHGAGAAVPPAGGINQIVKNVPGLLRVHSPIVARGGSDAETSKDIRKRAPASALVLGRCVGLADFAARVAGSAGVRNSKVEYAWDEPSQTAAVKVWYVPNSAGGDLKSQIVADLQAMSEPGTVIRAEAATALVTKFFVNVEIDRDRQPADVEAAVRAALLDPERGILAVENFPIGGPLARSALVAAVRAVPGVLEVTSLHYIENVGPVPFLSPGLTLAEGVYYDFGGANAGNLVVGAVHAESRGCRDLVS